MAGASGKLRAAVFSITDEKTDWRIAANEFRHIAEVRSNSELILPDGRPYEHVNRCPCGTQVKYNEVLEHHSGKIIAVGSTCIEKFMAENLAILDATRRAKAARKHTPCEECGALCRADHQLCAICGEDQSQTNTPHDCKRCPALTVRDVYCIPCERRVRQEATDAAAEQRRLAAEAERNRVLCDCGMLCQIGCRLCDVCGAGQRMTNALHECRKCKALTARDSFCMACSRRIRQDADDEAAKREELEAEKQERLEAAHQRLAEARRQANAEAQWVYDERCRAQIQERWRAEERWRVESEKRMQAILEERRIYDALHQVEMERRRVEVEEQRREMKRQQAEIEAKREFADDQRARRHDTWEKLHKLIDIEALDDAKHQFVMREVRECVYNGTSMSAAQDARLQQIIERYPALTAKQKLEAERVKKAERAAAARADSDAKQERAVKWAVLQKSLGALSIDDWVISDKIGCCLVDGRPLSADQTAWLKSRGL